MLPAGAAPAGDGTDEFARRPERPEDAALLFNLFRDAHDDLFAGIDPDLAGMLLRQQFAGQGVSYRAAFPEARFDVVEVGGQPVGRVVVVSQGDGLRLVDVALLRTVRGLGTALLRTLQDEARAAGLPLRLSVAPSNAGARRLHVRLGFAPAGDTDTHFHMQWIP